MMSRCLAKPAPTSQGWNRRRLPARGRLLKAFPVIVFKVGSFTNSSSQGRRACFYTRPMPTIADLRKSYERAELDERASEADPLSQFDRWFQQALEAQLPEPN